MSGNGGNLHSLRDLPGTYEKSGLDGRETWISCTDELVETVELVDGGDHLQLAFIEPTHKRTMNLVKTRDFALQVRVESRNSGAELRDDVYLLKIVPGRGNPITPTDEKPKGEAHWREIVDPQMSLDNS